MTRRGDYDGASCCHDCAEAAEAAHARELAELGRLPESLHLADRQLCERIAAAHYGAKDEQGGAAWASLAARIQRTLAGTWAPFTADDSRLVQAEHLAVLKLRSTTDDALGAAKVRSRRLSRLGVLLTLALRGVPVAPRSPVPGDSDR